MANAIRALAMDAVQKANSGHPGMPMGMADVATVLFTRFLKFDAERARMARPRPLRAVGRPRLDAALRAALSDRLSRHGYRAAQGLPPARLAHRRPPGIRPCARHRDHHRAARPGARQRGRHGARRAAAQSPLRGRAGRSFHLLPGRRRLPDGGHQPGGDLARRASQARPAHRPVRRQPDLDRRSDQPLGLRRSARALQGVELAYRPRRRPRRRSGRSRHRECQVGHRPAVSDRLPHRHRLWRAEQGRHRRHPRLPARRRGDHGRARAPQLAPRPVRGAEADPQSLARGGREPSRGL